MTNWKPTGNKIMVLMDPVEKKTASGIVLPDQTQGRDEMSQMTGTVVAMGPNAYSDQGGSWVQVGDKVKVQKFSGWLHKEGEDNYRVLHDLDVIMVLGKE